MKHFMIAALLLLVNNSFAGDSTPYPPAINNRFNLIEDRVSVIEAVSGAGGALASGKIVIGNASGVATAVTPSGDVTVSNTGVTAIGAVKVLPAMISLSSNGIFLGNTSAAAVDTAANASGKNVQRTVRATFDVAAISGGIGAHALSVSIPAKSILERGYATIHTQFSDSGTGTVALHCEDAGNILAARDITGFASGAILPMDVSGPIVNMVSGIGSECQVTATVSGADQNAGKLILFLQYSVAE
jgi:hypothetical protein